MFDFIDSAIIRGSLILGQADGAAGPPEAEPAAAEPAADVNPILRFLTDPLNLILLSAILFMFIVVRPQQKQQKELQKALANLKKNDRVVTGSGIHGTVVQTNAEEAVVTIRIDDNSGARMTVNRDTIAKIVSTESKDKS